MKRTHQPVRRVWLAREGAAASEYALLAALISTMLIASMSALGSTSSMRFNQLSDAMANAPAEPPPSK